MELTFAAKSYTNEAAIINIGMCNAGTSCNKTLAITIAAGDWQEYRVSLSCFDKLGVDMTQIRSAFMVNAGSATDIGIGNVRLESDLDAKPGCDGK